MNNPVLRNVGLLVARVVIGIVFLAHGLQKVNQGYSATKAGFEGMDVPVPALSAFYATWVETLGGIALIIGLLVPIFGVLLLVNMLGAFVFVHIGNGIYVTDGGWELVGALGAGALVLAVVGAGAYSVDALLGRRVRFLQTA
ncbi:MULTISPECIES: DoxX family protein [Rhodococcus]|uniref:DoxX family protein n=1 Tax=Rhodococcus TaxID=1827 RepID=UPI0007CD7B58|nr:MULTISPECIES: DoxX family protein [Rhodococcus]AWG98136.1 DoxX family protein [Rhodococcus ruber]MCZ1070703.1 DoxX family protein [Rhodococcus sp. A5(2022)]